MDLHSPSKPKRICPNEDRISKLPDAILTHLLSFLPENYAVRTGLLSTRWKYIWALLPTLHFKMPRSDCNCRCRCEETRFMDFIDKILILRGGLPIQKFYLSSSHRCDYHRVYTSLCNVTMCNIQALDLDFDFSAVGGKIRLPWDHFMHCTTLVVLKLSQKFVLDVPAHVCFPSLKTLHLYSLIYTGDASVKMLFSSCPMLEELHVHRFLQTEVDNVETINVSVPSLKRLSLQFKLESHSHTCTGGRCKYNVVIDAPNLECLDLFDLVSQGYTVIGCFPRIFQAEITVDKDDSHGVSDAIYGDGLVHMIRSIAAVKDLFLSGSILSGIGFAYHNVPTFPNLLRLQLGLDGGGWELLPTLLESMPNLEVLDFVDLRTVEVGYLHAHREEDQLKLIKYFLKNAKVLEDPCSFTSSNSFFGPSRPYAVHWSMTASGYIVVFDPIEGAFYCSRRFHCFNMLVMQREASVTRENFVNKNHENIPKDWVYEGHFEVKAGDKLRKRDKVSKTLIRYTADTLLTRPSILISGGGQASIHWTRTQNSSLNPGRYGNQCINFTLKYPYWIIMAHALVTSKNFVPHTPLIPMD
ncbi:hypothetical protein RJ640_024176 [Escallonia rubra]|uniref:F-box domain-containing protein n=1 Tax=Escallonia rubra TaxID=112253 RepID=A0AA88QUY5_9ASTE|nr:hypothetical protein RJ640_024176 [Escallonia rubra]